MSGFVSGLIPYLTEHLIYLSGLAFVIAALIFFGTAFWYLFRAWSAWLKNRLGIPDDDEKKEG